MNRRICVPDKFIDFFDQWAGHYDQDVFGKDPEYREVFELYERILYLIAFRAHGQVIEFGVGTGNLTKKLFDQGHKILGIEPSSKMREIAKKKVPQVQIIEGHFLNFPYPKRSIDSVVSSYAFHHLTDQEKEKAIQLYARHLPVGGKIIFGDTIFPSKNEHEKMILDAEKKGYHRLAHDLRTEYYTTIPILDQILHKHHFETHYEQMNAYVWIIEAKKIKEEN